jgi:hypothetical protein
MNSYRKEYSASDPDFLPALQSLDNSLRQRFEEAIATHTSGDPMPAALAVLKAYGLSPLAAVGN